MRSPRSTKLRFLKILRLIMSEHNVKATDIANPDRRNCTDICPMRAGIGIIFLELTKKLHIQRLQISSFFDSWVWTLQDT